MILFPSLVLIVFDPSPKILLFITVLHQLVQLFSLLLLDLISIFLILFYDLIGNHSFIFFQGKDHFLKVVVSMVQSLLYVAISSSELQAMDELWKLLIQLDCFFQVLFVYFLSQVLMEFAFLDDLFINFSLILWSAIIILFLDLLLFIKTCEIQVFMSLLKFFIRRFRTKIYIIELLQFSNIHSFVCQSRWHSVSIIQQCKLGVSFGYFDHFIGLFGLKQSLLSISYFFNPFSFGISDFVGKFVKSRNH